MDTNTAISVGLFTIAIGGIFASFFKAKGMDEAQQKAIDKKQDELHLIDEKQWQEIDAVKAWQVKHDKEEYDIRLALEMKIALTNATVGNLQQMLQVIEKKLDEIIVRLQK